MPLDDHTIHLISKKYSSKRARHFAPIPQEVLDGIEGILIRNKARAMESVSINKLNEYNIAMTDSINDFMVELSRTKVPKSVDVKDFDYDYQLTRQRALLNLLSNEMKIVERLEESLVEERDQLKGLKKFVTSYQKNVKKEKQKLSKLMGSSTIEGLTRKQLDDERPKGITMEDLDDEELNTMLNDLDSELTRLDKGSSALQSLSTRVDKILENLQ
jgi:hypothetical protein